jgi:hypothetical protein
MLITFERYAKLLTDAAVDESDDEFDLFVNTDSRPMPIGTPLRG